MKIGSEHSDEKRKRAQQETSRKKDMFFLYKDDVSSNWGKKKVERKILKKLELSTAA